MNEKIKKTLAMLLVTGTLVASNITVFASEGNVKNVKSNTNSVQAVQTIRPNSNISVSSISGHQPKEGFKGRLWCTADSVYIRNVDQGSVIVDTMTYGQFVDFNYVKDGKAYWIDNMSDVKFSVDIRYLSTVPC